MWRLLRRVAVLLCMNDALAAADTPFVVDQWRFGTHETNATLRYCIDRRDPDWTIARRVAASVADALLLQGREYQIGADPKTTDMSGEDLDDTYRMLIQHCDVFFGFKLVPDAYPDWVTITRPYYRGSYVYVAADPAWQSLSNMPTTRAIGATIGTAADLRLSQYLLALGVGRGWDKYPMASDEAALRAVLNGTTGAALVWGPALWALRNSDTAFAGLHEMAPTPLPQSTADVGAILLRNQSFLRTSVDHAIAALTADGTIAGILADEKFPGDPRALIAEHAIEVRDLARRYGRTLALDGISLAVRRRELFALLGPNGAGKTTLLHILCSLLQPDSGSVHIQGIDVTAQPAISRRTIGVVFQEPSLDDRLTVYENLNFHGLVYGVPRRLRQQRIGEMLALVELAEWRERLVRTLSSGMKRRVELARALIHDSSILFLDEPTVGLDAQSRERFWLYIDRLRAQRDLTVLVTTHYIEEVEACDRVCVIDHGKILALDAPAVLKAAHGQQLLRVMPREAATGSEIMAAYPDATSSADGEIILRSSGDAFAETFLARYGSRIRRLSVEEPSLESVFLSLTGREIRDQAAGARERTFAFGRQGGEHTR